MTPEIESVTNTSRWHAWSPGFLLVGLFLALTAGPVWTGLDHLPSKSIDMDRNHVPVIRAFAAEWPAVRQLNDEASLWWIFPTTTARPRRECIW